MIVIKEDKHNKLGGINSLFLSFSNIPNQDILSILKSCDVYNYNTKTHEWEFLINSLAYLLDNLTYFDDITLQLKQEDIKIIKQEKLITKQKSKLFKHQEEAVIYGLNTDKWLLLDAPGLGKSLTTITLAEELKARGELEHCLIICGINSLKTNWEAEVKKHSNLDSIIIGKKITSTGNIVYESVAKRAEQLKNKINEFFVIINVESLRDKVIIDAINNSENKFDMILIDEVHKCKSSVSLQGSNLLSLDAKYIIAMTGTLLLNSPLDSYVPLALIGKEKKNNITNFKKTFCVYDNMTKGRIIGFKNLDILKDEIESCSLRRTKDLLELPPKNIINEIIEMNDNHFKFYNNIKQGIKDECNKIQLKTNNLLSLITRLRQATSCPNVLTTNIIESTKIERCCELVEEIVSNGDKVVIFSNFKEPVYTLQEKLKEYSPLIATGDIEESIVADNIYKFQNNEINKVFIGTIQKLGTGFTLTKASYAIFIDLPWTYSLQEQAEDRIYRIGSEKPVFIYRLVCKNTIDELVLSIVERKDAISKYIIDDVQNEQLLEVLKQYILDL